VEWVPLAEWGAALRHHPRLAPAGANVDFVARLNGGRVAMRTYERGVEAETLACGSGAIASALWAASAGEEAPVSVVTAGGDELIVDWKRAGEGFQVSLTGPAEVAFRGEWRERSPAGAARLQAAEESEYQAARSDERGMSSDVPQRGAPKPTP
jgi:diaminopimelate epimerase